METPNRIYCLAEDRALDEVGLRLAVASLMRSCPSAKAAVYRPNPSSDFCNWLAKYPRAQLISEMPPGASSWNCKPQTMLPLLEAGADEAIWLDSDIIVTRDPSYLFDKLGPEVLVGTEEPPTSPNQGWSLRTKGWGLTPGRDSPITLNTCVMRVTRSHYPLLHRWGELLADPTYIATQAKPVAERPTPMMSDQDVLNALLGSEEFAGLSVHYLVGGRDHIHCGGAVGYSLGQRLAGLFRRIPPFLHAIGGKPWFVFHPDYTKTHSKWFTYYRRVLQETSPYVAAARPLRGEVGIPCPWLDVRSALGIGLRLMGFGHYARLRLTIDINCFGCCNRQTIAAALADERGESLVFFRRKAGTLTRGGYSAAFLTC